MVAVLSAARCSSTRIAWWVIAFVHVQEKRQALYDASVGEGLEIFVLEFLVLCHFAVAFRGSRHDLDFIII